MSKKTLTTRREKITLSLGGQTILETADQGEDDIAAIRTYNRRLREKATAIVARWIPADSPLVDPIVREVCQFWKSLPYEERERRGMVFRYPSGLQTIWNTPAGEKRRNTRRYREGWEAAFRALVRAENPFLRTPAQISRAARTGAGFSDDTWDFIKKKREEARQACRIVKPDTPHQRPRRDLPLTAKRLAVRLSDLLRETDKSFVKTVFNILKDRELAAYTPHPRKGEDKTDLQRNRLLFAWRKDVEKADQAQAARPS